MCAISLLLEKLLAQTTNPCHLPENTIHRNGDALFTSLSSLLAEAESLEDKR
jgi:hypothetical protein